MRTKKAIINIISTLFLQIITIICGFIIPKLIIKNFGSDVNGLVVSITKFLAYIVLLESGFGPVIKSLLYKPIASKDRGDIERILKSSDKLFKKIAYIFLIYITILCVVLPKILSSEFDYLFTISLIIIVAISTFVEYYFGMTYAIYLEVEQKTYVISTIKIITLILNTISIVLLIYLGASIQIVKLASCIIFVFRPIIQKIYVEKKYNINLKNVKDDYKIEKKWDGLALHIAYVIHSNIDIVILTLFTNLIEVSVYSVYAMIVNSIKNVVDSFTSGIDAFFGNMIAKGEQEKLNENFKIYEILYSIVTIIIFSATLNLIIPFVSIYTNDFKDGNYIRPMFAYLLVIAEFIWAIRQPYNNIIKAAGHFKQTEKGALVEVILNMAISIILVLKLGLVGVAIGTLIAMFIRAVELVYYTTKHILKRRMIYTIKIISVIIIESFIVNIVIRIIPSFEINNYMDWIIEAIKIFSISTIVILMINSCIYRKDFKKIINITKKIKGM